MLWAHRTPTVPRACDSEDLGRVGAGGWERRQKEIKGFGGVRPGTPVAGPVPDNALYSLFCPQWSQAAPTTEGEQKAHEGESSCL